MKTKTLIITLVLVATMVVPLALAADAPRGGQAAPPQGPRGNFERPGMGMGMGDGNFAQMLLGKTGEELNLTDAQKESIKKIAEEEKTKTQEGRQAVMKAMQTLNEAAEKGDEAAITAAGKAAGDALTQQALNKAKVSKQVKAVLTEEQLTKLDDMKTKMKERMEQRREQMRNGERRPGGRGPQSEETPQN